MTKAEYLRDLKEIISDRITVTDHPERRNMWSLGIEKDLGITVAELMDFMEAVIQNRREQARALGVPMKLYLWFEQQIGQLRLSVIPAEAPLSFACPIIQTADLAPILEQVLAYNPREYSPAGPLAVYLCML